MEHEVYYLRRRNLGNYEHAEASMRINVKDVADVEAAFADIKARVHKVLEISPPVEDYGKPAPNPVVEKMRAMNAAKTEVIRVCEPTEPVARPLRHIKKQAEAEYVDAPMAPVPTAAEVQTAFANKWKALGGTSVQTVRLKALLAEYGETDHTKVSPENRNAFLRALEAMQ